MIIELLKALMKSFLPEGGDWDADPLRVRLLKLAHLRRHLDPEVDLVGVLADHLQLDVLGLSLLVVGHPVGLRLVLLLGPEV